MIKSVRGKIEIEGKEDDVLTDLVVIVAEVKSLLMENYNKVEAFECVMDAVAIGLASDMRLEGEIHE